MTSWQILEGDCRTVLASLPERSVHTCVTSPPYFGLRDYGTDGQSGLEPTPDEFVAALVDVFREVRRVLRDDGTVWLNLGDSYAHNRADQVAQTMNGKTDTHREAQVSRVPMGMKPKDLLGIPWMTAFALRADGWYLRSDIIWSKPNPMPESVTDRPTKSHEYVFLLSKGPRYFYDAAAIREPHAEETAPSPNGERSQGWALAHFGSPQRDSNGGVGAHANGRNKRSIWTVATQPYAGAHFATFPPKLIEPCVLAGAPERACGECGAPWTRLVERTANGNGIECPKDVASWQERPSAGAFDSSRLHGQYHDVRSRTLGFEPSCSHDAPTIPGVVLDPFAGAGTTGLVALKHNRSFVGIELNPAYAEMARWRIRDDAPLLNHHSEVAA